MSGLPWSQTECKDPQLLINGKNICEVSDMPIPEAAEFIRQIEDPLARDIKTEI